MGTHHDKQQSLGGEFTWVEIERAQHAHGKAGALGAVRQLLGQAPTMSGLRSVQHRGPERRIDVRFDAAQIQHLLIDAQFDAAVRGALECQGGCVA